MSEMMPVRDMVTADHQQEILWYLSIEATVDDLEYLKGSLDRQLRGIALTRSLLFRPT